MSILEYRAAQHLELKALALEAKTGADPFYSLLQACFRQADEINMDALKSLWPEVWLELHRHYELPDGGLL